MQDLNEVMKRMRQKKQERKEAHTIYRDLCAQSKPLQDVLDQMRTLKAKKAQIEHTLQAECSKELEQVERLANDIKADVEMMSDMALTQFMKGETVEVKDENDVKYEPVFKVTFKKQG